MPQYDDGRRTDNEYRALVQEFADAYARAPDDIRDLFDAPPPTLLNAARKRADLEWDDINGTRTRWPELRKLEEEYAEAFDWDDPAEPDGQADGTGQDIQPLTARYGSATAAAWDAYRERVRARYTFAKKTISLEEDLLEDGGSSP